MKNALASARASSHSCSPRLVFRNRLHPLRGLFHPPQSSRKPPDPDCRTKVIPAQPHHTLHSFRMRRKNRKWVALAVGLYVFILFSAYRWGAEQRIPEGNIFVRLQREGIRRQAEERARAAQQAQQQEQQPAAAIGERRLSSAGPAYIAARYDATHVVFVVTTDAESRFANFPFRRSSGNPTRIPAPAKL